MASYIKTLKEDNGDITYPQTLGSAVLLTGGADLETELGKFVTAEDIATTSALTPPVQTAMIADGAVTAAKINSSLLNNIGSYSTTEAATPFTWIDGKTIYKKTINFGALPNNTWKSVAHGITNIDFVVRMEFMSKSSSAWIMNPATSTTGVANQTTFNINSTDINCSSGANLSSYTDSYVTLWYTKTS